VKNKLLNIPPIPAVLLAIISVQSGAAIAKVFSLLVQLELPPENGISAILFAVYRPFLRLPLSNGKL
jgi:inner membrane transporter RhtA